MTTDILSTPIVPTTSSSAEISDSLAGLPIVSETQGKEGCCESTDVAGTAASLPTGMHAESCSNHASAVVVENPPAKSTEDAGAVAPDDAALIDALREVIDPELMINIVDLGLVYSINQTDRKVLVEMTLTSPACPAGPQIISQAKMSLQKLAGVDVAEIKLTMSPPWTPDRMTDDARDQLGIF